MIKEKFTGGNFEIFRKNFLSIQKKYDEKIKELSILKEMNKTMQQIDFIDQDMIWIRLLECLKKYKSLSGAALYLTQDNEIKRDYFFYTEFEEPFDFTIFKKLSFFQQLLREHKVVLIDQPGKDTAGLECETVHIRYDESPIVEKGDCRQNPGDGIYLPWLFDYAFYGQSILSGGKVIAVLMLFAPNKTAFEPSHLFFYNVVCEHLYNSMIFFRLYYGKLNEEKQMIQLSRFFSKNVIGEIFKKGKLKLGGEKKRVAVLFVDLKGFTGLSETMKPEDVVVLLNRFFSSMIPIIFKNRGTLDKLLGDGIMAVFGTPMEDSDSCLNAVRTALEMFSVLNVLNQNLENEYRHLEMSVGINYGELIAGFMGSEEHLNYTVVGDTVNVAQRIQSLAGSNEIFVSSNVWNEIHSRLDTLDNIKSATRLDDVKLKGKEKMVALFKLVPEMYC
ncbi:MAG: adenylate/guanylate cyclase domain-containing protein [Desulfamplus sp.]|nr:adenylate/guanylate cyclase domain-containing protein [Desulfamplus sp.]